MNILFFLRNFKVGGVENVTIYLANEFVGNGHNVIIAYYEPYDRLMLEKLNTNVCHIILKKNKSIISQIRKIIKDRRLDLIINQWGLQFYYSFAFRLAMISARTKLISVYHNKPSYNGMIGKAEKRYKEKHNVINKLFLFYIKKLVSTSMRLSYIFSDRFVLLSETYFSDFLRFTGVRNTRKKLTAIPNPITCDGDYSESDMKEKIILYVGRIDESQKKVSRIISSWEKSKLYLENWKLQIVGDGPDRIYLESLVKDNFMNNVQFFGYDNPVQYYQKSKIICLTSDFEGFPLVLCEAMKFGVVPIVYNSFEVAEELIRDCGILVENMEDYPKQLQMLCSDDNTITILSEKVREKAHSYDIELICAEWFDLFKNMEDL